ncbi:multicopper oxidase domain-containing protein [Pedobacter metabolipauper]|uniref:FtsP/CotA-like multicopper oxidase with cupredoxin domain n=1 Tax=Pedobacter metabolipauper TaxID=425513 RepID=A0A4R6SZV9_9SPHI|nr:multicopper oxidase domain-containing protein [Pedobacter metabolipauper]TDQ11652.1 FtsP/CotA-like multicopper oxidase with cupredoxin domain [Pedobacter metabolipauper]
MRISGIFFVFLLVTAQAFAQKTTVYRLNIADTLVNYTGKQRKAISINGSIPGPELHFTEGDTAVIYVHNSLKVETSVHWHGLILPNKYDGVPYLTTAPVKPGETKLFKFPLVQNGTYWYHSHTMLQEQSGLYGAFIIHKKVPASIKEHTLLLSDWTDEKPAEVHRSLKSATDWYAIKKGSTQNYLEAIKEGHFKTKLHNEWKRMLAMDVSDVYYDRFLSNGMPETYRSGLKAGEKIRIRVINGSASTYFWLTYGGSKITVVANDGMDVEPVVVDRLIVGVSETYDVIVSVPENKDYEFRATSEDRTKHTSLWLQAQNSEPGSGSVRPDRIAANTVPAPVLPKLDYFEGMKMMNGMMNMDGSMNDMGMNMANQKMDMNAVMYPELTSSAAEITTLNYDMLRAPAKTTLPPAPFKELHFELTGNMNRYVWTINNKTVSETDKIYIKKGENVRIVLYNGTMMRHPMHLHGHFFRLINAQGAYSPLKNVLDIMPMETDTIEFAGTESGDWFFHCHILYHMMSGMGRIFSYENSPPNPEIKDPEMALKMIYKDDQAFHLMGNASFESTGIDGEIMLANTRYKLQTEFRLGTDDMMGYESETYLGRYIGNMQYLYPFIGWDYRYRKDGAPDTKDKRNVFFVGFQYTLPMRFVADARLDMKGKVRLRLGREDIPLTSRLRLAIMANTDREYMGGLRYNVTKRFGISTHYDSDMGYGAGFTLTY